MKKKIIRLFIFILGVFTGTAFIPYYFKIKTTFFPSEFEKQQQIEVTKINHRKLSGDLSDSDFNFEIFSPSNNKSIVFSEFNDKTIFLNIWATWCAPCREELPSMNALKKKFSNNSNIVFLNLSQEHPSKILKFISKNKYALDFYIHNENLPLILSGTSVPRTYIIKDKKILYKFEGSKDWNNQEVINLLN